MNTVYMNVQKSKTVNNEVTTLQFQVGLDGDESTETLTTRYNTEMAKIDTILNQEPAV